MLVTIHEKKRKTWQERGKDNIYSNTLVMGNETTINDIQVNNIRAPSIVVLGPVVDLRSKLIENVIKDAIT